MSKNLRIALVFGGFVTAVAAAFYPIFFYPLTHRDEYSKWLLAFIHSQLHNNSAMSYTRYVIYYIDTHLEFSIICAK